MKNRFFLLFVVATVGLFGCFGYGATLSVDDVSAFEGDLGGTDFVFTVTLSEPAGGTESVDFITQDGSALVSDRDYMSTSGTLTFSRGSTNQTFLVEVIGDETFEPDESFSVVLSHPVNATISDATGLGTIQNDDNTPPVAVDDLYTMLEDTQLIAVDAEGLVTPGDANDDGVLVNDMDVNGDSLSAILDAGPTNGVLLLNVDGTFEYRPDADFIGIDSFTYRADDGTVASAGAATVTITVTERDERPTVTITAPVDGAVFTLGDTVVFNGLADDEEDGDISNQIEWFTVEPTVPIELTAPEEYLGDGSTEDVALADFDNDGDLDAYSGNSKHTDTEDLSDWVWLNDGSGMFFDSGLRIVSPFSTPEEPQYTYALDTADVNGDGWPDILVVHDPSHIYSTQEILLNAGLGADGSWLGFRTGQVLSATGGASPNLGDIDNDGDVDLWLNGAQYPLWLNDGSGNFTAEPIEYLSGYRDAGLGDLDADGDLDIMLTADGDLVVYLNQLADTGTFSLIQHAQSVLSVWGAVELGDLDGDGDLDAVLANGEMYRILYSNPGVQFYVPTGPQFNFPAFNTYRCVLADLNGDSALDLVDGNLSDQNQYWRNNGSGVFFNVGLFGGSTSKPGLAIGDLDGDGDLDIFVGAGNSSPNTVWLNSLMDGPILLGTGASVSIGDFGSGWHTVYAKVTDSCGHSVLDSVSIEMNQPPVADDDDASVDEGGSVSIEVLFGDFDPDDNLYQACTLTVVTDPQYGTAEINTNNGSILYTHDDSETGIDSFTYKVADVHGAESGEATVTITITPVNDNAPVFTSPSAVSIVENTVFVMDVAATDADLPAATITYSITGGADARLFEIESSSGHFRFEIPPDYEAPVDNDGNNVYEVEVAATDNTFSSEAVITITVENNTDEDGDNLDDEWELLHFLDLDEVGDGDTDGDGLSNFYEMAFGANPNTNDAATAILRIECIQDMGESRLDVGYRHPRNFDELGLSYQLRGSSDLVSWTNSTVPVFSLEDDPDGTNEWSTYRITPSDPVRFWKIKATR